MLLIYQKISDMLAEADILYGELSKKLNQPIITEIINRYNNFFCEITSSNQNDAILENKIKNTPVQIAIIKKFETVDLSAITSQSLPTNIIECMDYLKTKKNNYKLIIDCIDLLTMIENLSEIEYTSPTNFEESEYAKLISYEDEEFKKMVKNNYANNNIYVQVMISIEDYIDSLNKDQKTNLYIEMLSLAYDRNSFEYFNSYNIVMEMSLETGIPIELMISFYDEYRKIVSQKIFNDYFAQRLSTIYSDLERIYNHPIINKNNSKK